MANESLRRAFFPYCLDRQGNGTYVLLNRRYKPVGITLTSWVRYDDFPVAVRLRGMRPSVAAKLSVHGDPDVNRIYLYDDATNPEGSAANTRAYMERLAYLMELKGEPVHETAPGGRSAIADE